MEKNIMIKKFEAGKIYVTKRQCGVYTYVEELEVKSFSDSHTILNGTWHSYFLNEHGTHFGDFTRNVCTKVRKAPGKDYQMTTELLIRFYSNEELL